MRIDELSVGDWVRYRDREWQVCSLYQFTEEVGLWRKDSQFCETITDIQPIRITSEILEKNGWVKIYESTWELGTHRMKQITKSLFVIYATDNEVDFSIYVTAVHELQRVCKIAGIEKEITL